MRGVFCTRDFSSGIDGGPESARALLARHMPSCRIVCLRQVHRDRIVRAEDLALDVFPEADGVVSTDGSAVLCIRTADCVPVLLWADDAPVVAAVHAGWRGLALGIVKRAIDEIRSLGARSVNLELGPSIGPCCYEVGPEVINALGVEPAASSRGAPSVDLHLVAGAQAVSAGVLPSHVHSVRSCTCCNPSLYFSYRRDGASTGRNLSVIGGEACTLPVSRAR